MTQRLKSNRSKLGRRRRTPELHSLKMEFMQNERMNASMDFFLTKTNKLWYRFKLTLE